MFDTLRIDRLLHARVDKVLNERFDRAKKIVERRRQEVERVADALIERGSLVADEIRDLVAQQPRLELVQLAADKNAG